MSQKVSGHFERSSANKHSEDSSAHSGQQYWELLVLETTTKGSQMSAQRHSKILPYCFSLWLTKYLI